MEKEHLEVILEDIQGKFELVLEGHESLRKEIREARDESNQKHEHTAFLIETIIKESMALPRTWRTTGPIPRATRRPIGSEMSMPRNSQKITYPCP